jgi:hypothetical protein
MIAYVLSSMLITHYCAKGCSEKARMASQKRATKKYQTTLAGRFNNAVRQQRFRARQK